MKVSSGLSAAPPSPDPPPFSLAQITKKGYLLLFNFNRDQSPINSPAQVITRIFWRRRKPIFTASSVCVGFPHWLLCEYEPAAAAPPAGCLFLESGLRAADAGRAAQFHISASARSGRVQAKVSACIIIISIDTSGRAASLCCLLIGYKCLIKGAGWHFGKCCLLSSPEWKEPVDIGFICIQLTHNCIGLLLLSIL